MIFVIIQFCRIIQRNQIKLTAIFTVKTPPSFVIVSLILSIAFSSALRPSAFSGVDVVITKIGQYI